MNWNSHEFVWLDWAVLVIGLLGVVWAVWRAIVKDKKASKGESSSDYLFGKSVSFAPSLLRSQHSSTLAPHSSPRTSTSL